MSMIEGIIHKALSGFYYVKPIGSDTPESADGVYLCKARGRFRHIKNTPLVGDRVRFSVTETGNGILTDILPRKNAFIRPPLANIDKLVIVASQAIPVSDPFLIDKMTVIALNCNCDPVICINKLDIDEADDLYGIYSNTGFPVFRTSAVTGDGIDALVAGISGSVCAFCGNSGVGKSSILNAIDSNFGITTGDVSHKLGRGRHTTRHVELYEPHGGTLIADTPGFSAFNPGFIAAPGDLQYLFPEFEPHLGGCRFDDCAHISEPGCSVLEAVASGAIHPSRHASYKRLHKQAGEYKSWEQKE